MPDDVVRAGAELKRIGARLVEASDGSFRNRLLAAVQRVATATIPDIQTSEYEVLPKSGGLAELIASSKIGIRARLAGIEAVVGIEGQGPHNLAGLNAGILNHPLFGNRGFWFAQKIRSGMFTDPIENKAPEFERGIQEAMHDTALRIQKG